jgi:hypothetical protein
MSGGLEGSPSGGRAVGYPAMRPDFKLLAYGVVFHCPWRPLPGCRAENPDFQAARGGHLIGSFVITVVPSGLE